MLQSLTVRNFTVFEEADLRPVRGPNVIVGENAVSKARLMKLHYAVMAANADEGRKEPERPADAGRWLSIARMFASTGRLENRAGRSQPGTPATALGGLLSRHASMLEQS